MAIRWIGAWLVPLAGVVAAAACGSGDGAAGPDAGPDAMVVAAPAPPAPATLTPCPTGWREVPGDVAADEPTTCDPYPAGGAQACAADEAHFPGEAGCAPIGVACPAGAWPEGLPATGVLYVQAGAAGGNGTLATPYGTIAAATAAATSGTVIALAVGTYDEVVPLNAGVTLWGACAGGTTVTSSVASPTAGVINPTGAGTVVKHLAITGARSGIFLSGAGRSLTLDGVLIHDVTGVGAQVNAGTLTATRLVVRDVHSRTDLFYGRALDVEAGGAATVTGAVIERAREYALYAAGGGTQLTLADVVVRDTASQEASQLAGFGLLAVAGAHADVARALVERARDQAVLAQDAATVITLTDVIVRDTQPREDAGINGIALVAIGGQVTGTRVVLEHNRAFGVIAINGGLVKVDDLVLRDMQPLGNDSLGRGVTLQAAGHAELTRAWLGRNRDLAAYATDAGSTLALTDVVIVDTAVQGSDGDSGLGLLAEDGATATVTRGRFERNHDFGIVAHGAGTLLTLDDVAVRDTRPSVAHPEGGGGVQFGLGAAGTAHRLLLEQNRMAAFSARDPGTTASLTDVVARDTASNEANGHHGRGLDFELGATGDVTRALIEGSHDVGLFVYGGGTRVTAQAVMVRDTLAQACAATGSCQWDVTTNVGVYSGASLELTTFEARRGGRCGLQVLDASLDLHHGVVAENVIGANIQGDLDLARLQDDVVYVDNEINFDGTTLPTPQPTTR